jgi:hypothetical protein
VHVQIHQPGHDRLALGTDDAGFEFDRQIDPLCDPGDDPPRDQDLFPDQLIRCVNGPARDEGEHGFFLRIGWFHG